MVPVVPIALRILGVGRAGGSEGSWPESFSRCRDLLDLAGAGFLDRRDELHDGRSAMAAITLHRIHS